MPNDLSLDHTVCFCQHAAWNRQVDLLRCLEIDHQLEFCRLLDEQSAKSKAQRVRNALNLRIVVLEYWSDALIRIEPTLHDSTTPSLRVFI